jgi:hypothetical protein
MKGMGDAENYGKCRDMEREGKEMCKLHVMHHNFVHPTVHITLSRWETYLTLPP